MAPKGNIWQTAVLAFVLVLLLPAANIALSGSGENVAENHTVTVEQGNNSTIQLRNNSIDVYDNETVWNASDDELTEGSDYEFFTENTTIRWLTSPNTTDGEEATIRVRYRAISDATETSRRVLSGFGAFIGLLLMLAALGALLVFVFGSGGF